MRVLVGASIVVFFALAQTSALGLAPIFGVVPNLVLLTLVAWTFARGLEESLPLYLVGGLALGALQGDLAGLPLLGLTAVAVIASVHDLRVVHSELLAGLLVVAVSSVAYGAVHLGAHALTGERVTLLDATLRVLLPGALIHAALFPVWLWTARGLLPERTPLNP